MVLWYVERIVEFVLEARPAIGVFRIGLNVGFYAAVYCHCTPNLLEDKLMVLLGDTALADF